MLVGDVKPEGEDIHRYRFKLILPPGKTLTQTVIEEFENAKPEMFALKTGGYTAATRSRCRGEAGTRCPPIASSPNSASKCGNAGTPHPEALMNAKFVKGELHTTAKNLETITYHIRNVSAEERTFKLDHHIRRRLVVRRRRQTG